MKMECPRREDTPFFVSSYLLFILRASFILRERFLCEITHFYIEITGVSYHHCDKKEKGGTYVPPFYSIRFDLNRP